MYAEQLPCTVCLTKFGIDNSSRFSFKAWTHTDRDIDYHDGDEPSQLYSHAHTHKHTHIHTHTHTYPDTQSSSKGGPEGPWPLVTGLPPHYPSQNNFLVWTVGMKILMIMLVLFIKLHMTDKTPPVTAQNPGPHCPPPKVVLEHTWTGSTINGCFPRITFTGGLILTSGRNQAIIFVEFLPHAQYTLFQDLQGRIFRAYF